MQALAERGHHAPMLILATARPWMSAGGFAVSALANMRSFRDNEIGEAVLPHLTVEDLKEIGVATVGDRRMLLAAIAALASDVFRADRAAAFSCTTHQSP